jgi:hypothetical protein
MTEQRRILVGTDTTLGVGWAAAALFFFPIPVLGSYLPEANPHLIYLSLSDLLKQQPISTRIAHNLAGELVRAVLVERGWVVVAIMEEAGAAAMAAARREATADQQTRRDH